MGSWFDKSFYSCYSEKDRGIRFIIDFLDGPERKLYPIYPKRTSKLRL